jgi:hypothetical protein
MSEGITTFVGLDVHKESIAIAVAVAAAGREAPHFIGTTGPSLKEVLKALSHLGTVQQMLIVYEAGPAGYVLVRQLLVSVTVALPSAVYIKTGPASPSPEN